MKGKAEIKTFHFYKKMLKEKTHKLSRDLQKKSQREPVKGKLI